MWSRRVSIGVGVTLAIAAAADPARAEEVEPLERVPVEIAGGAPGITVRVVGTGVDIACGEQCTAEVPPGRYGLVATGPDGRPSSRTVNIRAPSRITVTPHNQTARTTGLVLAPMGGTMLGASVLLFWWAGLKLMGARFAGCNGDECTDELPGWLLPTAFVTLGIAAVAGTTGLILLRTNMHAAVDMSPLEPRRRSTSRLRLLPGAGPRWAGLALNGSF